MAFSTIISTDELYKHRQDPNWAIIDCRFALAEPEKGRGAYLQGHIPGAIYAHLNDDLSSPVIPGKTGRHPLPSIETVAEKFSSWGIDKRIQVVAYDDWPINGASAARLWWLLRWLGHEAVAVLDGGWEQWLKTGFPQKSGEEHRQRKTFFPIPNHPMQVDIQEVDKIRNDPHYCLFDSRSADRYRGENETIDPIAGHIPGAHSAPFMENFNAEGFLLPAEQIRQRFTKLLNGVPMEKAIFYCGSGVTAAVNLLATVYAGMHGAKIYPGSWSEWIIDPLRPIAK
jgi:thiosulfate/3-mercaptopyruvate sulfurtransferase